MASGKVSDSYYYLICIAIHWIWAQFGDKSIKGVYGHFIIIKLILSHLLLKIYVIGSKVDVKYGKLELWPFWGFKLGALLWN